MIPDDAFDGLWDMEWSWFYDPFRELLGPVAPAIAAITILTMSYIYTGGIAVPTILSMLLGGAIIVYLPAQAQWMGGLLVLFGIFVGLYSMYIGNQGRL